MLRKWQITFGDTFFCRTLYKLEVIIYRSLALRLTYLTSVRNIYLYAPFRLLLSVPQIALALSAKSFSVSAPSVWINSLSYNCRSAELLSTFKRHLKNELFDIAYTVNVNTQPNLRPLCDKSIITYNQWILID